MIQGLGPLGDLFHGIQSQWNNAQNYQTNYNRLVGAGIKGGNFGVQPPSDADRLAQVLAYGHDPTQAQFIALLKQLGYLSHQAQ